METKEGAGKLEMTGYIRPPRRATECTLTEVIDAYRSLDCIREIEAIRAVNSKKQERLTK